MNKGTLELREKRLEVISIKYYKLFASMAFWRTLWMLSKQKLFSRMSTTRAKISLRNQGTLLV